LPGAAPGDTVSGMINRRDFVGLTLGTGAALVLTPDVLFGQAPGTLIQRTHPSSGERFPIISFSPREEADDATMKNILKTLLDNGGKVVDVLHGGPAGEQAGRIAAAELGIQDKFFWTTPLVPQPQFVPGGPPTKPDPIATRAALEQKFATFKVSTIDLVMVGSSADRSNFAYLREMKKEGRIRYIGVHHLAFPANAPQPPFGPLEAMMRDEQIDFIGTDYSLGDRRLEETILPLAQERKIGVLAYFPFDRGRMFQRASGTPLPAWAAEFDATTWAQFFLKYVISHPAVVMARTGTTKPAHMLENIGGGIGRLPDEATRKRMAALMDTFPPTAAPKPQAPAGPTVALSAAVLDRYVGEYTSASGFTATFRRDGDKLMVKPGNNPEAPLIARSETRFQDPRGPFFEFQLDGQGKVTGAVLEQQGPQGTQKIPLQRK
jgi:aryl-alcohol dehydrogenase-like predicted oxidoreductase